MQIEVGNLRERNIVIVGVGLIGGSIAAAVRKRFPECNVIGIGRDQERLKLAAKRGLLTDWSTVITPASVPKDSLGIVCLPVDRIAQAVKQLVQADCALVTDAGSVKASIYSALDKTTLARFVGSHPIAGSEHTGFESADADLFVNRLCVVTPMQAATADTERIAAFWNAIGSRVVQMFADEHDRILSLTSHLPHVMSAVTSGCVPEELLPFTGTGYRDTTRIAAGSASLWASILLGNAAHCVESINAAERSLQRFREAISAGDAETLQSLLEVSARQRKNLNQG
jgi:prephenate dehydrogenase